MKNLLYLQQAFAQSLNSQEDVIPYIKPHYNVSPAIQLSIYQNAYFNRLQKSLKNIYSVCYHLVGDDFFLAMTREFITETPSNSPDLNTYGQGLAFFIRSFAPASSLAYLADVAQLEWACHIIHRAQENVIFNFEKLSAYKATENIIFSLPKNASLIQSIYPIHHIWQTNQPYFSGNTEILLNPGENYYFLVWRKDFTLRIDLLTIEEWQILTLIEKKSNIHEICKSYPDNNIAEIFPKFIHNGWVRDCFLSSDELL